MSTPALLLTFLLLALALWLGWHLFLRRRKVQGLTEEQRSLLEKWVRFYRRLSAEDKRRFEQDVAHFLSEVAITGVETEVEETDRLLVAASAVIPLFGFPGWRYRNLNEVLLYPGNFDDDYQVKAAQRDIIGMVGSGAMNRMMILSRPALRESFAHPDQPHHVGIHEFIHLLDKADGYTDGVPEDLIPPGYVQPWLQMMQHKIEDIKEGQSDINPYGSVNKAEFLSVAAEYFFTRPEELAEKHPELYEMLSRMFQQKL